MHGGLPGVCFGAFTLLSVYAFARSLFNSRAIATAATIFLALDGVFFVQSRIGMTNIYTVCFIVLATYGTWQYIKWADRRFLLLTGFALGFALCTRWSSLWAWGLNGVLLLWYLLRVEVPKWKRADKNLVWEFVKWGAAVAGVMVVIPVLLYAVSYIPFVLQGSGDWHKQLFASGEPSAPNWSRVLLREQYAGGHGWYKVVNQQKDMWFYHAEIKDPHPYSSPWWSWPLMLRPTWYYYETVNGRSSGIWAIGNAAIWWASVPALLCTGFLALQERRSSLAIVTLFGLGMWLAWGIKARPLVFMHYYFEAVPFICIALAYLGWRLWQAGKSQPSARRFVIVYASAVGTWFLFYYPLLSAYPVSDLYFRLHLWLDRIWI